MPQTDSDLSQNEAPRANGGSTMHDLFALTDEQILEIEPEPQDVQVSEEQLPRGTQKPPDVAPASLPAGSDAATLNQNRRLEAGATQARPAVEHGAQAGLAVPREPPAWLAAQMKDPWTGQEAQELWNGVQQAKSEAAAYRAAFATPEDARALKELYPGGVQEARATADRARTLDDIDRAYFGATGNSPEQTSAARAQLAQTMLRENPAAFREMVFAGLRVLEEAGQGASSKSGAQAGIYPDRVGRPEGVSSADAPATKDRASLSPKGVSNSDASAAPVVGAQHAVPLQGNTSPAEAQVAAYAAFEKAANEDLERSVGGAIARTIEQALPNLKGSNEGAGVGARSIVPLQDRLTAAVRQDVEAALKGDRQLGEQIAQILSARRFDNETRTQVVRLIGERAQQLVPGATKRVLNDWTQTTLAAHRGQTARADAASARREVSPVSGDPPRGVPANTRAAASATARSSAKSSSRPVDYRKLSDEQILDL